MRRTCQWTLPLALAATVAAAPAASAQEAERATVADGETMLRLDRATGAALASAGVRVSPVRPATTGRSGLTFPATGGSLDPRTLQGRVDHRGGLRFRAGSRSVALTQPRYTITARRATLSALVGDRRVSVARLDLRRADVGTRGPLTKTVSGIRATLTTTAARALNRALHTHLLRGGVRLGTVRTQIDLGDAVFAGGATTLALDAGAAGALQSLGIAPGVVGDATASDAGLAFPITGGAVDAQSLAGEVRHGGGISLTRGATRVELTEFTIGIDDSPALSALVGGQRVEILALDVSGIQRSVEGRDIVVSGVVARLTAPAAGALNQAFGTTAFTEGLVIGTATLRGRTA